MSNFNLDNFWAFCADLRIDSKDRGPMTLSPANLMGTQRYVIEEIARGLSEGVHKFVILKGRQQGVTTITLALDLYWLFKHAGLSGSLVTHDEESRDMFKTTLEHYVDGLPNRWKVPITSHNRTQLVAKNRSRVAYQVAGTRKKGSLGRGKGLTFLHATEVSSWGDEEGLASLQASMSEEHADRLEIYETTARGYNMFKDMWDRAKNSTQQRAIFCGWWRKESYSKPPGSPIYDVYWKSAPRHSAEERKWIREVKSLYDFDITPEQIAWWRWKLAEEIGDQDLMYQEYPPTENYAFIASGSNFFNIGRLTDEMKAARKETPHTYKFSLRENFQDTDLVESPSRGCNLKVWQYPQQGARYAIGADPAFGSSDWADRFVASVWRCYGDGIEQVAEFCTEDCNTFQFAWVILYLAGAYQGSMLNLEINGPGQHVWNEMLNMRRMAAMTPKSDVSRKILLVVANLQNYLYKRLDTFGRPNAYHWQSTTNTKERMLNFYKAEFERGTSTVRSVELIEEMRTLVREDGQIAAQGRHKDDRVIAAGLAHVAWSDYVRMQCMQQRLVRPIAPGSVAPGELSPNAPVPISLELKGYLQKLGIRTETHNAV